MKKAQLYTIIILSFCSSLLDFLTMNSMDMVFPRNRIVHIFISSIIAFSTIYILKFCDFDKAVLKFSALLLIAFRAIFICREFIEYFHTFHGSNSIAIVISSVAVVWLFWNYIYDKTHLLYSFFVTFNISMFLLLFILCTDKMNMVNIYSGIQDYGLEWKNIFVFFDIFTIAVLVEDEKEKIYAQRKYLLLSVIFMTVVTLLQGLCVSGNILYSISPLQSLVQILYTDTIKRFDYIFTIYYTLDYFAAVMLYSWTVKSLFVTERKMNDEKA